MKKIFLVIIAVFLVSLLVMGCEQQPPRKTPTTQPTQTNPNPTPTPSGDNTPPPKPSFDFGQNNKDNLGSLPGQ